MKRLLVSCKQTTSEIVRSRAALTFVCSYLSHIPRTLVGIKARNPALIGQ